MEKEFHAVGKPAKFFLGVINQHLENIKKWSNEQPLPLLFIILSEEVGEIARGVLQNEGENVNLRKEIVDATAVLLAMFEKLEEVEK